jgi:hypothetical protein
MKRRYRLSVTINGKRRYTTLYRRWMDMKGRTKGYSTRSPHLYAGIELHWKSFAEFRVWALSNGFSKETSSPDRKDADKGYVPGNVKFVPCVENYRTRRSWQHMQDDTTVRGEEPPEPEHGPHCACEFCADYWAATA